MKSLLSLLLAPTLALSAANGSVTLLDGTPVSGAVIKSLTDSVTTSTTGTFVLGRTSGISSRYAKTIPVTSHLVVENGRPRLSFAGMDIAGRSQGAVRNQRPQNAPQALSTRAAAGFSPFAARSLAAQDTLKVYWKGKRLTILPVTSDTTVTFRIDTAWKDDAGIPWNPAITYGSIYDARDGQTYRTVTIGSQTWMAENLNYAGPNQSIGHRYNDDADSGNKYGRLYNWSEVTTTVISSIPNSIGTRTTGICPIDFHVSDDDEWNDLRYFLTSDTSIDGQKLKSTNGWNYHWGSPGNGTDTYGFRALPGGSGPLYSYAGNAGAWWTATDLDPYTSRAWEMTNRSVYMEKIYKSKSIGYSLRCIKN